MRVFALLNRNLLVSGIVLILSLVPVFVNGVRREPTSCLETHTIFHSTHIITVRRFSSLVL